MIADMILVVVKGILPYLSPIVFIIGAVTVADRIRDLMVTAFNRSAYGSKRRGDY